MAMLRGIITVIKLSFAIVLVTGLICWIWALCIEPSQKSFDQYGLPSEFVTLDQGWSDDVRQQIHFTSFGSRLLPYNIYVNLELADSQMLLKDPVVAESLGFIRQNAAENNPDALPVGFAANIDDDGTKWIGLTCAACHTGQVNYRGKEIFIEGGPGLLDFTAFEQTVLEALDAALNVPEKFQRLESRINSQGLDTRNLRSQLSERSAFMGQRLEINKLDVPYGYGRVDAFGQIFNAVSATALDSPANHHMPNAPVSIPVLWDASHLDLVQWNASAPNKNPGPLGQNVTTALAVYGQIDLNSGGVGYTSSVEISNLGYIQNTFYTLNSPQWPEHILGKIDQVKANAGKVIYDNNCLRCHSLVDRDDPERKIKAVVVPLEDVNTDPLMASNFVDFQSNSESLNGKKRYVIAGTPFTSSTRTFDLVINAAIGVMLRQPIQTLSAILNEESQVFSAPLDFDRRVYKARPLNGIWAAGPYLHNGSVPTLWDVLQAPDARPSVFYVGSRELDTTKVGLVSSEVEYSSEFDTKLPGNSNQGHEYGVHLNEDDKWALIEYLKTL